MLDLDDRPQWFTRRNDDKAPLPFSAAENITGFPHGPEANVVAA